MDLPRLNIPHHPIRISRENDGIKIYDILRKKSVCLTPEEHVRQCFVNWLVKDKGYPPSLMANEIEINLNNTKKRCDTVVFDNKFYPLLIIEYKAPNISITQKVFDQIIRYNFVIKAPFMIISNGLNHYCAMINPIENSYCFLSSIPDYRELSEKISKS